MTAVLTERQKKWFATVQANLEKNTGKPLADWIEIMKTCPETAPRAQAAWLKAEYGVGQDQRGANPGRLSPRRRSRLGRPRGLACGAVEGCGLAGDP